MKNRLQIFRSYLTVCANVVLLLIIIFPNSVFAQGDTIRVATYNLLNYPGTDSAIRDPYFRRVLQTMKPDILVDQEMQYQNGQTNVDHFRDAVLNASQSGLYSSAPFHHTSSTSDTENSFFYKGSKVEFIGANYIPTALRDIAEYIVRVLSSNDTLHIFSVHLKASNTTTDEQKRQAEATILRNYTNNLPAGTKFLVVGDFNTYKSSDLGLQKMLESEADDDGRAKDPLNAVGIWNNNSTFASIHTQSPRVRSFGGGITGGLDDRFDLILTSYSSLDANIITSHYTSYGNDGNHFNDSINRLPNLAVPDSVANGLHYAADHLPVYCDFIFTSAGLPGSFTLSSPANTAADQAVSGTLSWQSSSGATQYDVYLDANNPPTTLVSANQPDTLYSYSGLLNSTTYRWKVVAKDSSGSAVAAGSPWSFTTIVAAPASFTLISPSNGAAGQPTSGNVAWQASANAAQYDVYLDSIASPVTLVSGNQIGTTYHYTGLLNSQNYYWKVVAKNTAGNIIGSGSPWAFTIVGPSPSAFTLSLPANAAQGQPLLGMLIWNTSNFATGYDVYLDSHNPPTTRVASDLPDTAFSYGSLNPATTYYWKVVAKNTNDTTIASDTPHSFATVNAPPAPTNVSSNNTTTSSLHLTWTDNANDETGYRIYRSLASGGPFVQIGPDLPANSISYSDTGLSINQRYYYRIAAFNDVGEGSYASVDLATLAVTPGTPVISNPGYFSVTVVIDSASDPSQTQFAIRAVADTIAQFVQADGSTGALPAWRTFSEWGSSTGTTVTGLHSCREYSFSVVARNLDNIQSAYGNQASEVLPCFFISQPTVSGWNLMSVPITISDLRKASVFPASISGAFFYQGSYVSRDTLNYGAGFWLNFADVHLNALSGEPRLQDSIILTPGWNMIGSISNVVAVSSLVSVPGSLIASNYFGFDGSYVVADSIHPMKGYWVKANASGRLVLNAPETQSKQSAENVLEGMSAFHVEDSHGNRQTLYIGSSSIDDRLLQHYELPPVPPAGSFDVRFKNQRFVEIVSSDAKNQQFPVEIQAFAYPIRISWEIEGNGNAFYLRTDGGTVKLLPHRELILEKPSAIVALSVKSASSLPLQNALDQNYPNPFNPTTTVSFVIGHLSFVTLRVFDVLGREVAALVNEVKQPGSYSATWDASTFPSGMYYCRLVAGEYTATKKLVLIK